MRGRQRGVFKSWIVLAQINGKAAVVAFAFGTILCHSGSTRAAETTSYQFNFGRGPAKAGYVQVTPTNFYSDATGYGFEPGAKVVADHDCITGDQPFYFSAKLPEGDYRVTVTLGDQAGESTTTIKAELRRLMLYHVHTAPGRFVTRSLIVNVRTPKIVGDGEVRLKSREKTTEWWAWDDKLTLEFNDTRPCVDTLKIEKVDVPTLFILGDSTVCDQPAAPWNSWGQMLPVFFKPDVAIADHAESGETIADSLARNRFRKVFSLMKPGDYLFIQFGHNDMKNKRPDALERYTEDFKRVVRETRAKGGTPVLVTSMEREAGVKHPTLMGYPQAMRAVAREEKCALIDLNKMSLEFYRALGTNLDKAFVPGQGTHHDNYGSYEFAKCIVAGIKQDKLPLANHIVDDFKSFDPAHPDPIDTFYMPISLHHSSVKPLGN